MKKMMGKTCIEAPGRVQTINAIVRTSRFILNRLLSRPDIGKFTIGHCGCKKGKNRNIIKSQSCTSIKMHFRSLWA